MSLRLDSTAARPLRGWSDTYSPSISRSKLSLVFLSHSSIEGTLILASPMAAEAADPAPSASANRSNCPSASLRFKGITWSIADSWTVNKARRLGSILSNAPLFIRDSTVRLLSVDTGIRSTQSRKPENFPFPSARSRSSTIDSTIFVPTLRTAPRPKRISSPTAE